MATAGSIVVDLLMRTGAFETDTKRAEDIAKKRAAAIDKAFAEMGRNIGLAATFVGGSIAAMVVSTANAAKEINNLANLSGAGTEEFQRFAGVAVPAILRVDAITDVAKIIQLRALPQAQADIANRLSLISQAYIKGIAVPHPVARFQKTAGRKRQIYFAVTVQCLAPSEQAKQTQASLRSTKAVLYSNIL